MDALLGLSGLWWTVRKVVLEPNRIRYWHQHGYCAKVTGIGSMEQADESVW